SSSSTATSPTDIYTPSLHDALPISTTPWTIPANQALNVHPEIEYALVLTERNGETQLLILAKDMVEGCLQRYSLQGSIIASCSGDRKSTRLNSSHVKISYAVFCLKK